MPLIAGPDSGLSLRVPGTLLTLAATLLVLIPAAGGQSAPSPVAAYSFNEGSGTTVADASGTGNAGTIGSASWTTQGKYGNALVFNGTNARVTVPDSPSLRLASAMTLEAWVLPTAASSDWKDIIYKGNDNYYLMASSCCQGRPGGGGIFTGSYGETFASSNLALNTWTHLATTYDGTTLRLYVNGVQVASKAQTGTLASSSNPLTIGGDPIWGQHFAGRIDEVRVYAAALSQSQVQADMANAIGGGGSDTQPPTVSITSPQSGANVSDIVNVTANASDNVGVVGVQFYVDGNAVGAEDAASPYGVAWDSRGVSNGVHSLSARARDAGGNATVSTAVPVTVSNSGTFQNEILATDFDLPTSIEFLPDGRMLIVELAGRIEVMSPPYTDPSPTPFLQLTNVGSAGVQQGIYDIALDPNFAVNRFYYVFYTLGTPNRDRLARFTANATLTGTVAGSELVLYQDPQDADEEHHGGAINFANDGKLLFTTGEHFIAEDAQLLTSPRGKVHRINPNGTIPTDNPFHDGAGPNVDSIWALGLRNPFRAYYDAPSGRFYIGDVGGNDNATSWEELDAGVAGANYGWPNCELGNCGNPSYTPAIYSYAHNNRDAAITGGFVYHGTQFPSTYQGSYFFADYTQNWIRRLTFDANGNVTGVFNFEPTDGSLDGPYGDIVYLTEGPDGALYYVDLGYSDIGGTFGLSKIRRIRHTGSNQPPTASAAANPSSGAAPLSVAFSSAGSSDPEGQPLTYAWTFGDGGTSSQPNPTHVYSQAGQYTARLSVSDGVNTTLSAPLAISAGGPPTATILTPQSGAFFVAGDVISFSGDATDPEDGTLPASAFTWNVDFLHEGHVHPGNQFTGVKNGSFTIPTVGHDFSGNTRYRIALTVTDSNGLSSSQSVLVFPTKVNLSFNTLPSGLTLHLDGIARTAPFVYDTLVGFNHTIEARNQTSGSTSYTFSSWSDGGGQTHMIVAPTSGQSYVATFQASGSGPSPVAAYSFNEGSGTTVADASGTGNAGTIGSASWTTQGKYGNALVFNGTNARVTVPDSPSLRLASAMTLEAWVLPTAASSDWKDIIYKGNDNYYLMASSCCQGRPGGGGIFTGSYGETFASSNLALNTWTHLATTYDGTTLRLYVNGVQVASKAQTGTLASSSNPLTIGGDPIWGQHFAGRIDEVRVYAAALSQSQVQADMANAIGGGGSDTQPPTAPTSLIASAAGSSQINLSWQAASDNVGVTGYRIERCQGAGCSNFAEIATTGSTAFSNLGLSAATSYSYRVRANDAAGNLGPYSNVSSAQTQSASDTQPPTAPTSLIASAAGSSQINLSWQAASDNVGVTGYRIERCQGAGCSNFAEIATTGSTAFSNLGLSAATSYSYRVRANDAAGNLGPYSNVSSAQTQSASDTQPPTAPTSLIASAAGSSQINLSWQAASDNVGVTGYRIERCQGAGCSNFAEIATTGSTAFSNLGLSAATSYSYRVRANDAAGNLGPYSNVSSAQTQSAGGGPSPVAAYSFNEGSGTTVADASGTGNAGTIGSASWTTQGKYGNALVFNGTNARVTVPDSPSLRLASAMTLEAWVLPTAASSDWKDIIYKGNDNYYLMASSCCQGRPGGGGIFTGSYGETFASSNLALNTWTHLATTYDGTTLRLYVNGVQVASKAQTGTLASSSNPLTIGGDPIWGQHFAGRIDEVRVYAAALSQSQVQADMANAIP